MIASKLNTEIKDIVLENVELHFTFYLLQPQALIYVNVCGGERKEYIFFKGIINQKSSQEASRSSGEAAQNHSTDGGICCFAIY